MVTWAARYISFHSDIQNYIVITLRNIYLLYTCLCTVDLHMTAEIFKCSEVRVTSFTPISLLSGVIPHVSLQERMVDEPYLTVRPCANISLTSLVPACVRSQLGNHLEL
jgi:hypothetical protein